MDAPMTFGELLALSGAEREQYVDHCNEAAKVEQSAWTDADQAQLQRDHPPPVGAIVINRRTGELVGMIPWATRNARVARPSRPGRTRTIRRQAHSSSTSRRGPPDSEDGEPEPPGASPAEVETPEIDPTALLEALARLSVTAMRGERYALDALDLTGDLRDRVAVLEERIVADLRRAP